MINKSEKPAQFTKFNFKMKSKVNLNLEILSPFSPNEFQKVFDEFKPVQGEVILKNEIGQVAIFDFNKNWIEKVELIEERESEEDK